MLHQTLCLFDNHFSDLHVTRCGFIEGGGHNLTFHRTLHIGDFFWTFVDQQYDQEHFRMVFGNGAGDILQQHGFTRTRRRNDECALALTLRADNIDNACRLVLHRWIKRVQNQF